MEENLSEIESGKLTETAFLSITLGYINERINTDKSKVVTSKLATLNPNPNANKRESIGKCPKCGGAVYEWEKNFSCEKSRSGCNFTVWKNDKFFEIRGKNITITIVKSLLKDGKALVKGFKKKDGGTYDAYVVLDEWTGNDGKARVSFKIDGYVQNDE
jgi:hypothetical protein